MDRSRSRPKLTTRPVSQSTPLSESRIPCSRKRLGSASISENQPPKPAKVAKSSASTIKKHGAISTACSLSALNNIQKKLESAAAPLKEKRKPWDLKGRLADAEDLIKTLKVTKQKDDVKFQELKEQVATLKQQLGNYQATEATVKKLEDELCLQKKENAELILKLNETEEELKKVCCERLSLRNYSDELDIKYKSLSEKHENQTSELKELHDIYAENCKKLEFSEASNTNLKKKVLEMEEQRRHMHNKIQELKGNIRVFCRVRPCLKPETTEKLSMSFPDESTVSLMKTDTSPPSSKKGVEKIFQFDRVFTPKSTQGEVFDEVSCLIQSVLDGYNVSIFAYGQTGSGKTHTMDGPSDCIEITRDEELGIIPRALRLIFNLAKEAELTGSEYEIVASAFEVYNETIRDLLVNKLQKDQSLQIKHHNGEVYVKDLVEIKVTSPEYINDLMIKARKNRKVAATLCNGHSSRSHSIFQLKLNGKNYETGKTYKGILSLVDLAGSERLKESQAVGDRLTETKSINTSLSSLGNVITALAQKADHVPYRNSKLTHVLMNSLGGNSKTLMLLNIAPEVHSYCESLNSLRFGKMVNGCKVGIARKNVTQ